MSCLVVFSNCFLVKGFKRSIICDAMRSRYDFIPNSLYDLLIRYNKKDISAMRESFTEENAVVLDSYLAFLFEKEYIFLSDHPEMFPDIDVKWESPCEITNAIIDFDRTSDHDLQKVIDELTDLRCSALEIRTFDDYDIGSLRSLLRAVTGSSLRSVNLLLKFHVSYTKDMLKAMIAEHPRIMSITVHSTTDESLTRMENNDSAVFFIKNKLTSELHCGAISKFNFSSNIQLFMEAHFHNSCLNRKVSIDKKGMIKNCPSLPDSFGHHRQQSLRTVVAEPKFRELWNVNKDSIEVCKDCEFRYICTDCRAYTTDNSRRDAKPAKCGYDPYNATWSVD